MSDVICCNICACENNTLIRNGVFGSPRQNIYECNNCGHFYLAPAFTPEEDRCFYINEYPDFLMKRGDSKSLNPEKHFNENKKEAERRFAHISRFISKGKRVLEIGSASGFFLHYIRNRVTCACGIEPNSEYFKYAKARGIHMFEAIEDIVDEKFDLIFLYYVLEHVKEPVGFLRVVRKIMRNKSSRIVIEVPNINEALISLYKSSAYNEFVWQRAHYSYFTVKTLKDLFSKTGLSAEFIPVQKYDFSNHLHWLVEGKPGGFGKYKDIFSDKLTNIYQENLKKSWLCDGILAVAGINKDKKHEK